MRAYLDTELTQFTQPQRISVGLATDAELLIELIDGRTTLGLREFNTASVTVLAALQCEQTTHAVDRYFTEPRQWPRHHALKDARALRHARAGFDFAKSFVCPAEAGAHARPPFRTS